MEDRTLTPGRPADKLLQALIVVEGLASLGIEVVALRRILPYVGSSITITAPTIALFLGALALGYHRASRLSADFERRVQRNFLAAAVLAGVGLSSGFARLVFSAFPDTLLALSSYLLIAMAAPAYLLAQTVPAMVNVMRATRSGEVAGRALAWSTLGSVISALALSLLVMPWLGLRWAVMLAAVPMAVMVLLAGRDVRLRVLGAMVTILIVAANLMPIPTSIGETAYGDYALVQRREGGSREGRTDPRTHFMLNGQSASQLDSGQPRKRAPYIEHLAGTLREDLGLGAGKRILVLGAGGFTLSMHDERNDYTYVDIDPKVRELAEEHFLAAPIQGRFVVADARQYVMTTDQRFDAVIVDTFSNHASVPAHLVTLEFWQSLRRVLASGGSVLVNLILEPRLQGPFARNALRTIDDDIGPCAQQVLEPRAALSNVILVCRSAGSPPARVYLDERNPVDWERHWKGY